ncbi:uncharacterized protein ACJ7VT_004645 [Polymixia lowei]
MAWEDCPPDSSWDKLVKTCIFFKPRTKPATEPAPAVAVRSTTTTPSAQVYPVALLSPALPALWVSVVVVAMGLILALVLWFIIYRQQTGHSNTAVDSELGLGPLAKTEPLVKIQPPSFEGNGQAEMLQTVMEAPPSCPHLNGGAQTGLGREADFIVCEGPPVPGGTEGGEGLSVCSEWRKHRIPLPATELGDTALVTTKTI